MSHNFHFLKVNFLLFFIIQDVVFVKCGQKIKGSMKKPLYENPDKHVSQKSWEQHISFNTGKLIFNSY